MITVLSGGVGGAKLLTGLSHLLPPEEITIIGNTGDDFDWFGLRVCPDLDTIAYTLAGRVNPKTGWGIEEDTFDCLGELKRFGCETWFRIGDRDMATHLLRTQLLDKGLTLSEVTGKICTAFGIRSRLFPMTDAYVPTRIVTDGGDLHLQEYLVRHGSCPAVRKLYYSNIEQAQPSPQVKESILGAKAILVCPSNPFISIGPILAVPGLRSFLQSAGAPVIAVTPIVGARVLRGPAAKMLREQGFPVSAHGVAQIYQGIVDVFVLDKRDSHLQKEIGSLGMQVVLSDTVMTNLDEKRSLARRVLELM